MLLLYVVTFRWRKKAIRLLGDPSLVMQMMERHSPKRKTWKVLMLCVALICFAIALANLRMG
ncbi:MAG: hypothetical protein ACK4IY_06895, partial [Chitinophagales bacterium]